MTETPRSPDGRYTFKGDTNALLRAILRRRQQGPVTVPRSDPNALLRQIIAGHDDPRAASRQNVRRLIGERAFNLAAPRRDQP